MSYGCYDCGRFVGYDDMDEFIHFGSASSLEPPDPIIICGKCAKNREDEIVNGTKRPARPYIPWRPGFFHYHAIARLGMVLAGPKGAAWCEAFWPGQIPTNYTVWENPSSLEAAKETT